MPIDYSKYPKNWKTEIRPRILKRAGEVTDGKGEISKQARCEFCNVENYAFVFRGIWHEEEVYQYSDGKIYYYPKGEYCDTEIQGDVKPIKGDINQKAVKIILTIAHLNHDEENHNVEDKDLAALCQKCHLNYDRKEKERRRKEKEYSSSLFPFKK